MTDLNEAAIEAMADVEHWRIRAESAEAEVERLRAVVERVEARIYETIADLPEGREEWAHGAIVALRKVEAALDPAVPVPPRGL